MNDNINRHAIFVFDFMANDSTVAFSVDAGNIKTLTRDSAFSDMMEFKVSHFANTLDVDTTVFTANELQDAVTKKFLNSLLKCNNWPSGINVGQNEFCRTFYAPFLSDDMVNLANDMQHRTSLCMASKVNGQNIDINFPSHPNPCSYTAFIKGNGQHHILTAQALYKNPIETIKTVAAFLCNDTSKEYAEILVSGNSCQLNICKVGNDIHLTENGEEAVYWSCDEFSDSDHSSIAEEVLGAICGALMTNPSAKVII